MSFLNFIFVAFFIAHAVVAMEEHVVITSSAKAYFIPIDPAMVPDYKKSSLAIIHGNYYLQIEEFLLNERVSYAPSPTIHCHGSAVKKGENPIPFGGMVLEDNLLKKPDQSLLNFIVIEPTADITRGQEKIMTVSMGTKLELWGEINDTYGVKLPDGRSGWIQKSHVKRLEELRATGGNIVSQARKLLGREFRWGSRSALLGSGFDCAGLVITVFRSSGVELPRPVAWQRDKAQTISPQDLRPGDLIFTHSHQSKQAVHVVIWTGENGTVIEASTDSMTVREASVKQVYGKSFDDIKNGQVFYTDESGVDYSVTFGRVLNRN